MGDRADVLGEFRFDFLEGLAVELDPDGKRCRRGRSLQRMLHLHGRLVGPGPWVRRGESGERGAKLRHRLRTLLFV